ncbi:alpha/beta-hydrolase [Vararia minispora EC-137]|uniref:Alpha/beta-hydrolase n=1 Tax=Vararia minispora EC-137 TaxID=1314806 RepID=A0ACB8QGC5_9AGAM|nr:alpha/beta-hydrolase [Vararia minispora EC-137]
MFFSILFVLSLLSFVRTSPLSKPVVKRNNGLTTTAVAASTISSDFVRPAQFSRLAYCSSGAIQTLSCGGPCDDLGAGSVTMLLVGGDGGQVPHFFVAQDATTKSIVVAHQGTNSSNPLSVINDLNFSQTPLNATLFPGVSDNVQVHEGFAETQGRTADAVLAAVQSGLASTGFSKVLVTGHSLGAAIATMDALMLNMNLGSNVQITTTTFGLPRGGNQDFANLVDSQLGGSYTFITHGNDPVPIVPPQAIGYVHSSGEVHITDNAGTAVACPGQENENCIDGTSLLDVNVGDHLGPYFSGIFMSGSACPNV